SSSFLFSDNLKKILSYWGDQFQMTVYLSDDLNNKKVKSIAEQIKENNLVKSVQIISNEQALFSFQKQMASYAPDLLKDPEILDFIPNSLVVSLKEASDKNKNFVELKRQIQNISGVSEVSYGEEWLEKYAHFVQVVQNLLLIVCIIFSVASFFIISNAIRALVEEKREEIEILELIGATYWSIRKEFIIQGASMGLGTAALGLSSSYILLSSLKSFLIDHFDFFILAEKLNFHSFMFVMAFAVLGTAIGAAGCFLAARSINTGWAAAAKLKKI
ncbi:MAG: cell division protein FtsX, partial [Pseudobdellovibrionaceae bacterium]